MVCPCGSNTVFLSETNTFARIGRFPFYYTLLMPNLSLAPRVSAILLTLAAFTAQTPARNTGLQSSDLLRMCFVGEVAMSPDGSKIAYSIVTQDGPGRPAGDLWIWNVADGTTHRLCKGDQRCGGAVWSPNSEWIAFHGGSGDQQGLHIAHPDGSGDRFVYKTSGTNNPLPTTGATVTWSPDNSRLAF